MANFIFSQLLADPHDEVSITLYTTCFIGFLHGFITSNYLYKNFDKFKNKSPFLNRLFFYFCYSMSMPLFPGWIATSWGVGDKYVHDWSRLIGNSFAWCMIGIQMGKIGNRITTKRNYGDPSQTLGINQFFPTIYIRQELS